MVIGGLALSSVATGCTPKEQPYEPKKAYSGKKPNLPTVPALANKAKKEGDAYTVWGAIHDVRSEVHQKSFDGKEVTILGFIVKTNWENLCKDEKKRDRDGGEEPCVPKCAIHTKGKQDADDCIADLPSFWIAEHADEKDYKTKAVQVLGLGSNFAQLFTMIEEIDKKDEKAEWTDEWWQVKLPNPMPNNGAKVKVTGKYGITAAVGSKGSASNPRTGIMHMQKIEYVEPPKTRAILPGMKTKTENKK
jgi:hypothetical protein